MSYQDTWKDGQTVAQGDRECAERYEIVRQFCAQYTRPFTVLDIGAAQGYFGARLTEDFPDCTVVSIEKEAPPADIPERVIWLNREFIAADFWTLGQVEHFDVVLAMSVVHHFDSEPHHVISAMQSLGDHLIIEIPVERGACNPQRVNELQSISPACRGWMNLGHGKSHLEDGALRPIWLSSEPKCRLVNSYLGTHRADLALLIASNFKTKKAWFWDKDEIRDWYRGINLRTFLRLGGAHPTHERIREQLHAARVRFLQRRHRDIAEWNIILQGDDVQLVDYDDPNHIFNHDDIEKLLELEASL